MAKKFVTKEGYEVLPGMWIEDNEGVYEVVKFLENFLYARQVIRVNIDDPDDYDLGMGCLFPPECVANSSLVGEI